MGQPEVLLIGGRAGVGKSTVVWEVSARLRAASVAHAIVEGDFMGQVHPAPDGDPGRSKITEQNLTAVWANYARLGYRRLVYTNTVSVLPEEAAMFERAMGAGLRIVRVLLTASDATVERRLAGRELGSGLSAQPRPAASAAPDRRHRGLRDRVRRPIRPPHPVATVRRHRCPTAGRRLPRPPHRAARTPVSTWPRAVASVQRAWRLPGRSLAPYRRVSAPGSRRQ